MVIRPRNMQENPEHGLALLQQERVLWKQVMCVQPCQTMESTRPLGTGMIERPYAVTTADNGVAGQPPELFSKSCMEFCSIADQQPLRFTCSSSLPQCLVAFSTNPTLLSSKPHINIGNMRKATGSTAMINPKADLNGGMMLIQRCGNASNR